MELTNEEAERLVEQYADLLLRVAYAWTGSEPDAQDVCQTVLIQRLTTRKSFDGPEHERAWLIRLAINRCKNLHKSPWRSRRAEWDEAMAAEVHMPEESDVLDAVRSLPPKQAAAIFLRYYEEYSVGEIGEIMGVRPALVSTWLARGREKLKAILGGKWNGTLPQTAE